MANFPSVPGSLPSAAGIPSPGAGGYLPDINAPVRRYNVGVSGLPSSGPMVSNRPPVQPAGRPLTSAPLQLSGSLAQAFGNHNAFNPMMLLELLKGSGLPFLPGPAGGLTPSIGVPVPNSGGKGALG